MVSYKSRCVVLDTNMLLSVFEHPFDLEDELCRVVGKCSVVVPRVVMDELVTLSDHGKGSAKRWAKAALKYVKQKGFRVEEGFEGETDDVVFVLAKKLGCLVATNDKELIRRLREEHVPVLFLRENKKLVLSHR